MALAGMALTVTALSNAPLPVLTLAPVILSGPAPTSAGAISHVAGDAIEQVLVLGCD